MPSVTEGLSLQDLHSYDSISVNRSINSNLYRREIVTTIYFVRHAEPNYEDRKLVTEFLLDKQIDIVLSSPYKRAVDTIRDFAEIKGLDITIIDEFKERRVDSGGIEDFNSFCKMQWEDFSYKLSDGESLQEVQNRNVFALSRVLEQYRNKKIVVGSHGTALSTIIHYFDKTFGYSDFDKIRFLMPWIVEFTFEDKECINIRKYNLLGHSLNKFQHVE